MIENKILRNIILIKCKKDNIEDLSENELEKVKDISLNKKNVSKQILDIDLSELNKIPNLEILSLQNFEINEQTINDIKKCKDLKVLHLETCNFNNADVFKIDNLKKIIIKYCKVKDWRKIYFPENVVINAREKIDLKEFNNIENIINLKLNNLTISNFKRILNFENLKYLNIDGSIIDSNDIQSFMRKEIEFSHKKHSRPIE